MKVRKLLDGRTIAALTGDDTVIDAVKRMTEMHCGSVLIRDEAGEMRGIFTERDLMVRVVSKSQDPASVRLQDVMTTDLYTASPERTVVEVRREMRKLHVRHVPIVEGDRVLAVLSMRDLLRADLEEKRENARHLEAYIRGEQ